MREAGARGLGVEHAERIDERESRVGGAEGAGFAWIGDDVEDYLGTGHVIREVIAGRGSVEGRGGVQGCGEGEGGGEVQGRELGIICEG